MSASVRILVLGVWTGLLLGFGLIAAVAFRALPETELAARVVGQTLVWIDGLGMACGGGAALLALVGAPPRAPRIRSLLPLLGAALHAASAFGVSPEIQALREAAGGSIGSLAADDPIVGQFARLHRLSTTLYLGCTSVAIATAVWDIVRSQRNPIGPR
jgi:hypothetical protein